MKLAELETRDRLLQPEQHLMILNHRCDRVDPEYSHRDFDTRKDSEEKEEEDRCTCPPCECGPHPSFMASRNEEDLHQQLLDGDRVTIRPTPFEDAILLGEISAYTHHGLRSLWHVGDSVHHGNMDWSPLIQIGDVQYHLVAKPERFWWRPNDDPSQWRNDELIWCDDGRDHGRSVF